MHIDTFVFSKQDTEKDMAVRLQGKRELTKYDFHPKPN